jgi:hypothetical protein
MGRCDVTSERRAMIAPHYYASRASAARFVGPLQSARILGIGISVGWDRKRGDITVPVYCREYQHGSLHLFSFLSPSVHSLLLLVIVSARGTARMIRFHPLPSERGHSLVSTCSARGSRSYLRLTYLRPHVRGQFFF